MGTMSQPPYGTAHRPGTADPWATAALITALVAPPVGIVLGVMAGRRVRRSGESGAGLARAAVVVGIVLTVLWGLLAAYFVVLLLEASHTVVTPPAG
jgi:hypothetical protein